MKTENTKESKRQSEIISEIKGFSNSEGQVSHPVFIVIGYRFANKEKHSYPVGVYHSDVQAIDVAEKQTDYRGGKYSFSVYKTFIGTYDLDGDNYCEEIYSSKIPQHYIDGTTPSTKEEKTECNCPYCEYCRSEKAMAKTGGEVDERDLKRIENELFGNSELLTSTHLTDHSEQPLDMITGNDPFEETINWVRKQTNPLSKDLVISMLLQTREKLQQPITYTEVKWDATDSEMNDFSLAHADNILDTDNYEVEAEKEFPYDPWAADANIGKKAAQRFNMFQDYRREGFIRAMRKMSLPNKKSAEIGWDACAIEYFGDDLANDDRNKSAKQNFLLLLNK